MSWGDRCKDADDEEMDDAEMVDAAKAGEEQYHRQAQGAYKKRSEGGESSSKGTQDAQGFTVVSRANKETGQQRKSSIVPPPSTSTSWSRKKEYPLTAG